MSLKRKWIKMKLAFSLTVVIIASALLWAVKPRVRMKK